MAVRVNGCKSINLNETEASVTTKTEDLGNFICPELKVCTLQCFYQIITAVETEKPSVVSHNMFIIISCLLGLLALDECRHTLDRFCYNQRRVCSVGSFIDYNGSDPTVSRHATGFTGERRCLTERRHKVCFFTLRLCFYFANVNISKCTCTKVM